MPTLITDLVIERVDLVDDGANSEAFIKLYKRRKELDHMNFDEILKELKAEHVEAITAELAKAKAEVPEDVCAKMASTDAELEATKAELAEVKETVNKAKEETSSDEDVIKSLDPAVQELFKSMTAQKEAAEAIAKQLNEQKVEEEAITKAKELKSLPADEKTLVMIAKTATPEVFEVLKAASKLVEDSEILKEKGSASTTNTQDAWAKIEKAAIDIATADNITQQKAIARVIKEQPDLYREYLKGGI
jgi:predicted  nucleic acid-binding Zn-ribbon protein